ncbi:MAG: cytochrome-c oxidase, cbb3-type subunit III [Thiotrichales bacterium]
MSGFWSGWIIVIVVANILACYWLIKWTMKSRPGEAAEGDVTGHSWDGLEELNNPLPRWWLWLFYITIIFAFGYLALYPGLGAFKGFLNWTSGNQWDAEMASAEAEYGPVFAKFSSLPIPALASDKEATDIGRRLFLNHCAQCHGSGADGNPGYPALNDSDWLWGGSPEKIKETILNGRNGIMPSFAAAVGGEEGATAVANYVATLSGREKGVDTALVEEGKTKFGMVCAGCHMPDGTGNQALGAPNLTDKIWLHGSSISSIKKMVMEGKHGVMPAFKDFLGEDKSHLLAAYIYSLSNK